MVLNDILERLLGLTCSSLKPRIRACMVQMSEPLSDVSHFFVKYICAILGQYVPLSIAEEREEEVNHSSLEHLARLCCVALSKHDWTSKFRSKNQSPGTRLHYMYMNHMFVPRDDMIVDSGGLGIEG